MDDQRRLETWLAGSDTRLRDLSLEMLLSVARKDCDRVARLLSPYTDKDEDWKRRVLQVLRPDPSQDSDSLFEIRIQLAEGGSYTAKYVDWQRLAQLHPTRFIRLMAALLKALVAIVSRKEDRLPGLRAEINWHTLENVNSSDIASEYWAGTWKILFQAIGLLGRFHAYFETSLKPVLRLLKDLGRALLVEDWQGFVSLGEELSGSDRHAEVIFLDSLVEGPSHSMLADWALEWLMADPWRARLTFGHNGRELSLACRLIERYAPVCSLETYQHLERWLLAYREADLLEDYKWRHELRDLSCPSLFGETPHALLPKLPDDRRSTDVIARISQLNRKFAQWAQPSNQAHASISMGLGKSPFSQEARSRLSDESWLAIAAGQKSARPRRTARLLDGVDIEETPRGAFATAYRDMAAKQPDRFAKLALRLPPDASPVFLGAILGGLTGSWDHSKDGTRNPPSHATLESLLGLATLHNLVRADKHCEAAMNLCRLLERHARYPWSSSVLDLLVWLARHHSNPTCGLGYSKNSESVERLEDDALNCVRGTAALTIQSLLFAQPDILAVLRSALASLIQDEHPAVRAAAIAACLPVLNIDRDLAVQWFLQACDGPDAILASSWTGEFLDYATWSHLGQLAPVLGRMVRSPTRRVATAGAFQIAVCFLVQGILAEEFAYCIDGTPPQRQGVAQVAAILLEKAESADKAKVILLRLADDEDQDVARVVARSFSQLDLRHITSDPESWSRFASSRAFQEEPSPLLYALDRQSGDLLPFADCLLAAGSTLAEESTGVSDAVTRVSGNAHRLVPLLLRLHAKAQASHPAIYLRCLDLWDRLLECRVGTVMDLTQELDRL